MVERWIRKLFPDYRSKRELVEEIKRYEKENVVFRIEVSARISDNDLYKWCGEEGYENVMYSIERKIDRCMMSKLKRHLHIKSYHSITEMATYYIAHIDVADKWEGKVVYEQGNSDRQPDARS